MRSILFHIFLLLSVVGCSDITFVYENTSKHPLKNKTYFTITGDNTEVARNYLNRKLAENESNEYNLKLNIINNTEVQTVEKDSTASKYSIKHSINYVLMNNKYNCVISAERIDIFNSFDSKSEGYNFGSDRAKTKTIKNNIEENIESFLNNINRIDDLAKCINEN